jgi:rhamnosyltransferase
MAGARARSSYGSEPQTAKYNASTSRAVPGQIGTVTHDRHAGAASAGVARASNSHEAQVTSAMDTRFDIGPVCGVMVTYECGEAVAEVVGTVLGQVDHLAIVDNGSGGETRHVLQRLRELYPSSVTLLLSEENLGIATALNQGARFALERGFGWILALDQDSYADRDMVKAMAQAYGASPDKATIGIIAPRSTDAISGKSIREMTKSHSAQQAGVEGSAQALEVVTHVHSSGSLLKSELFHKGYWFRDEYFIDCVDFEYCLKIRRAGYKVYIAGDASMLHSMGDKGTVRVVGKSISYSRHSPTRQYYMTRNFIALFKETRNWNVLRWYLLDLVVHAGVSVVFEESRMSSLQAIGMGTLHGVRGRLGKRPSG